MSASKRKFNAILQGLSDSRPGLEDGSSAYDALLQKRRRLGFPSSTAPKFDSPSPTNDLAASLSIRRSQADRQKQVRKPAVRYCPSDRDELLKRLETFQDITRWTPKPDKISEIEWAKRGWLCQSKETVRCVLCSKELVLKLARTNKVPNEDEGGDDETVSSTEALVDKYAELVVSSHQEDCLWRKRGCDDSLLRLSLANAATARLSLRQRYDELLARKDHLPYDFNLRLPAELDVQKTICLLPHEFFASAVDASKSDLAKPNTVALALALCGWQGLPDARIGSVSNSISCRTCLRRLGLWMFKSKEVDSSGKVVIPAPMEHLDTVREHRFFCPWRNPSTQAPTAVDASAVKSVPAWGVLIQTLRNEAHLRTVYGPAVGPKQAEGGTSSVAADPSAEPAEMDENDEEVQKAKDKERWARLKKIKSLFDIKGGKGRSRSRPGTSHSTHSVSDKRP
ncbi:hypothetical protein NLU13_7240 [Sarocladium strictum]|uniref:Uncharacterized protein n=1 Tax=Sarocladium strictum TaxID=5046 RepID=A0AA39GET8_SARSR|nr:hypothetical protein NLU13_7240 [Sarocladium strictum]